MTLLRKPMKDIMLPLLLALALLVPASCARESAAENVQMACEAYDNGDYAKAREICDRICVHGEPEKLEPGELCKVSLLLNRLSEVGQDRDECLGLATLCLSTAMNKDRDTVALFIQNLPLEDRSSMDLIAKLCSGAEIHKYDIPDTYENPQ